MNRRRISSLLTRLPLFPLWPEYADLEGIRVPLRDSPLPPRLRRHLMRGCYETDERRLVQEFVRPGDQVIEVGASSGVVTSFLWRQVGREGRVVSVEGNASLRPFFDRVLAANDFKGDWVEAIAFPVWTREAPGGFHTRGFSPTLNPLGSRVSFESMESSPSAAGPEVKTLQQIAELRGIHPTVLVADIEGTEGVWCGMPPALPESVKTVIIEIHPRIIGITAAGGTMQALIDEGFRIGGVSGEVIAFAR